MLRLVQALAGRSDLLVRGLSWRGDLVPALSRIAAYAGRWIRTPEEWRPAEALSPGGQWSDLLRHLFVRWPVPAFFESAWFVRGGLERVERDWYCDVAQGGSWRKSADLPRSITRQAFHRALAAPEHFTIPQALRWAQLECLGAPAELKPAVLCSPMAADLANDDVWSPLFAKLVAARFFDPRDFGVIAEVLLELIRGGKRDRALQLVGLPLKELLNHSLNHWQHLAKTMADQGIKLCCAAPRCDSLRGQLRALVRRTMKPMAGVGEYSRTRMSKDGVRIRWAIVERLSQAELVAESRELRHCVERYWTSCARREVAIFSLVQGIECFHPEFEIRRLTMEVDIRTRTVRQIRGSRNRLPVPGEFRLVREWADENRLLITDRSCLEAFSADPAAAPAR